MDTIFSIEKTMYHRNAPTFVNRGVVPDVETSATQMFAFASTYKRAIQKIAEFVDKHNLDEYIYKGDKTRFYRQDAPGFSMSFTIREIPKKDYTLKTYREACENPIALYDEKKVKLSVIREWCPQYPIN